MENIAKVDKSYKYDYLGRYSERLAETASDPEQKRGRSLWFLCLNSNLAGLANIIFSNQLFSRMSQNIGLYFHIISAIGKKQNKSK